MGMIPYPVGKCLLRREDFHDMALKPVTTTDEILMAVLEELRAIKAALSKPPDNKYTPRHK